jgi:hypothetical protein
MNAMSKPRPYKEKTVISGPRIEHYEYEELVFYNYKSRGGRKPSGSPPSPRHAENRKSRYYRARQKLSRLIWTNFQDGDQFITLTFDDPNCRLDLDAAQHAFKTFIQRLRRQYGSAFRYIQVMEQRGSANHFHLIADLPSIPEEELTRIWGNGSVTITEIYDIAGLANRYMLKEMHRSPNPTDWENKRIYTCSRNIKRPEEYRHRSPESLLPDLPWNELPCETTEFASPQHGRVLKKVWNLSPSQNKRKGS